MELAVDDDRCSSEIISLLLVMGAAKAHSHIDRINTPTSEGWRSASGVGRCTLDPESFRTPKLTQCPQKTNLSS